MIKPGYLRRARNKLFTNAIACVVASTVALTLFSTSPLTTSVLASERVVLIGDSHAVGAFGVRLDELLRTRAGTNEVFTYASCGSSPAWWFNGHATPCGYFQRTPGGTVRAKNHPTPKLEKLIGKNKPTVIVVALGANLVKAPIDYAQRTSKELALLVSNNKVRCIWVGPPHGRNKPEPGFSQFYSALKAAVVPPCEFIDSRPYARYPDEGGDGIHYDQLGAPGVAIARQWAESVFTEMKFTEAANGRRGNSQ